MSVISRTRPLDSFQHGLAEGIQILHGANEVWSAANDIVGTLPMYFTSKSTKALKNYKIYGHNSPKNLVVGKILDANLQSDGTIFNPPDTDQDELAIAPIEIGKTYTLAIGPDETGIVYGFYSSYPTVGSAAYGSTRYVVQDVHAYTVTAPIDGYMVLRDKTISAAEFINDGTSEGAGAETDNLFDKGATNTNNGYLANRYLNSMGNAVSSTNWDVSEYISVNASTKYTNFSGGSYEHMYICFYTDNKTYISGVRISAGILVVTTPENASFVRISVRKSSRNGAMFIRGEYAERPSYIPYGYKITFALTSGQNADTYPLYIGSTKLGAEESVDYAEQKLRKRTVNCYNYALNSTGNGYVWGYYLNVNGGDARGTIWRITEYIAVSEGVYTLVNARDASTASAYVGLYDSTKTLVSTIAISPSGESTEITVPSGVDFVRLSVQNSVAGAQTMLVKGNNVPAEYAPYFVLTDPPAPLPAITAYESENTLSSTETVGEVTLTGRLSKTLGFALTQAAYDLLTPVGTLYYVINSMASGEAIHATLELSQAEYDVMSSHVADTLYIIMDGTDIEDVRLGDTQADKLYLGSTVLWTFDPTPSWVPADWAQRMPVLPSSYASYCVIAIKYGNTICVFKIQARDMTSINQLYMSNPYFSITRPLHDGYAAWGVVEYSSDGTYRRTFGVLSYSQYAGTTLANAQNYGGMPTVNAVCLEHQGDVVWYDYNTGIGLDYI